MLVYWSAYLAKSSKCRDVSFHARLAVDGHISHTADGQTTERKFNWCRLKQQQLILGTCIETSCPSPGIQKSCATLYVFGLK